MIREIRTHVRGDAWNAAGEQLTLELETPQGYALTVDAALLCAERVLRGDAPHGALTPSQLVGADAVLALPGVRLVSERAPSLRAIA